jgi:hypothetical protein
VFLASHCAVLTREPARMAEYFPHIDLPFPRAPPIKTTDEFGAYARRIYASLERLQVTNSSRAANPRGPTLADCCAMI